MYLMRFRLKSPVMIQGLFSNVSFLSRVVMKSLLDFNASWRGVYKQLQLSDFSCLELALQ